MTSSSSDVPDITEPKKKTLIARGTYSDVYQETDGNDGSVKHAKKTIRLPLQNNECSKSTWEKLKQVLDSAKQLKELEHSNIVKFIEMTISIGTSTVGICMELVEGDTLDKVIKGQKVDDGTVVLYADQICSALDYLHTLKPNPVLHRDINTRTIMVTKDNKIKLIDFGLAVQLVDSASEHVSADPKCDPCFTAPELFLSENTDQTPYSCASDIWAFGCVVYQMTTGIKPHAECKNMLTIVRKVMKYGAPKLPDGCSSLLNDFYSCCTEFDREVRKSAAQLLQHEFLKPKKVLEPVSKAATSQPPKPESRQQALKNEEAEPDAGVQSSSGGSSKSEAYPMTSSSKGLCLVISVNKYTDSTKFPAIPEQQQQAQRVKKVFEQLKFQVVESSDCNSTDIWATLHGTASSQNLSNHSSFICFIMGYGSSSTIFASDGEEIEIQDIISRFRASQCSALKGKPKLFFVQTAELQKIEEPPLHLREADFLICRAVNENGRLLVPTLCSVIEDVLFSHSDIESITNETLKRLELEPLKKGTERFCSSASASSLSRKFTLQPQASPDTLPEIPDTWSDELLAQECTSQADPLKQYGPMDQSLLMIAAIKGKHDQVWQLLMKHQTSLQTLVSAQDVLGRTAISWAAVKGHGTVLSEFQKAFRHDADTLKTAVNRGDHLSQTPIILAAKHHQTAVLEQLKTMGADVNRKDSMEFSALTYAAKLGFEDTAEMLLDLGADAKQTDFSRNTALIWAARCGHRNVINLLGDRVCDVKHWKQQGERGMNAQDWAKFCERFECAGDIQHIIQTLSSQSSPPLTPASEGAGGGSDGDSAAPNSSSGGGGSQQQPSGSGAGGPGDSNSGASGGSNRGPGNWGNVAASTPYTMSRIVRGIALIVNILDFPSQLQLRAGSMDDMRQHRLELCFSRLGFDCREFRNVRAPFFETFLSTVFSPADLAECQSFLLCILSHGEQDYVFSRDGVKVLLESVFSQVRLLEELRGKPKIFITQACRDVPDGRRVDRSPGQGNAGRHEDCLYFYSVVRGDVTLVQGVTRRSLFTNSLCDVILNDFNKDTEDFPSVMQKVVSRVGAASGGRQVPCSNSTLTRPLVFRDVGVGVGGPVGQASS